MALTNGFVGNMFTFGHDPYKRLPAFHSGDSSRAIVIVGGQTDGLLQLNYITPLETEAKANGWSVVQCLLGSSLASISAGTHVSDADDLAELIDFLVHTRHMKEIALFAYSSGIQVALEFLRTSRFAECVTRVILQGIVCDPKAPIFTKTGVAKRERVAAELVRTGHKGEFLPIDVYDLPLTAARIYSGGLLSLQEAIWVPALEGDEATLRANLSCVQVPLLIMLALGTDYSVPAAVRDEVIGATRKCAATCAVEVSFFEDTCDERRRMLKACEAQHTAAFILFLLQQDRQRLQREEEDRAAEADEKRRQRSILAKEMLVVANRDK